MKKYIYLLPSLLIANLAKANIAVPDTATTGLPDGTIKDILLGFLKWSIEIFLILAVLSFVITGVMYLIAMGDARSQTLDNAKQNFRYSIIAVATVGASYIIIMFINNILKGTL